MTMIDPVPVAPCQAHLMVAPIKPATQPKRVAAKGKGVSCLQCDPRCARSCKFPVHCQRYLHLSLLLLVPVRQHACLYLRSQLSQVMNISGRGLP